MAKRLTGMAEAERQTRVATRLYEAVHGKVAWEKVTLQKRRPYIDRAAKMPHLDELK